MRHFSRALVERPVECLAVLLWSQGRPSKARTETAPKKQYLSASLRVISVLFLIPSYSLIFSLILYSVFGFFLFNLSILFSPLQIRIETSSWPSQLVFTMPMFSLFWRDYVRPSEHLKVCIYPIIINSLD